MRMKLDPRRVVRLEIGGEEIRFPLKRILVPPGRKIALPRDYDPGFSGDYKNKSTARKHVAGNVKRLAELQSKLYAQDAYSVLVLFQAMDAAGKDGAIRHVMSGVNPQGCHVTSFKVPSAEELDHDYLWRAVKALPARGMIGIFNRSYYEEVLVVRVHPEILKKQKLPDRTVDKGIWKRRFEEIVQFEKYLVQNGTVILKFFLNVSKREQKKRFLSRIDEPEKNWKFSVGDYKERGYWDDYQRAYQEMLSATSTDHAPWFVIPADRKWFTRLAVSEIVCRVMEGLDLKYPTVDETRKKELFEIRSLLEAEDE